GGRGEAVCRGALPLRLEVRPTGRAPGRPAENRRLQLDGVPALHAVQRRHALPPFAVPPAGGTPPTPSPNPEPDCRGASAEGLAPANAMASNSEFIRTDWQS